MQNKRMIRLLISFAAALATFVATRWASILCIEQKLGKGSYAVTIPLFSVLSGLAALSMLFLLLPKSESREDEEEDEPISEPEEQACSEITEKPIIDESVYPELFTHEAKEENEGEALSFPDIKKFINEQKADADIEQDVTDVKTAWDEFVGMRENAESTVNLYTDIPAELPEDYVPNYETEDETDEEEEIEEEVTQSRSVKIYAVKAVLAVLLALIAVFLPANLMTVYTPDSIVKYSPIGKTEYKYADAEHYTVGVKLSGDISVKVYFNGGKEFELVFDGEMESDDFIKSFSSSHSYAAFCDRLMKKEGVDKNIGNLASLTGVPEEEYSYANEITEGYLEANK